MVVPFEMNVQTSKWRFKIVKLQAGYTLLEIMLVIALIGIMLSVTFINLQKSFAHHKLHVSARRMLWEIRTMQASALTEESSGYKILFDVDPSRNTDIDRYYIKEGTTTLKTIKLPAGINLYYTNFEDHKIYINLSGYPLNGFGGTIQIENKFAERLYVVLNKTGRVRIDNKPPSSYY